MPSLIACSRNWVAVVPLTSSVLIWSLVHQYFKYTHPSPVAAIGAGLATAPVDKLLAFFAHLLAVDEAFLR